MTSRLAPSVLAGLALVSCSSTPKEPSIDCSNKITVAASMLQVMKYIEQDTPYDEGDILRAVGLLNQQTNRGDFNLADIKPFCGLDLKGLEAYGKNSR